MVQKCSEKATSPIETKKETNTNKKDAMYTTLLHKPRTGTQDSHHVVVVVVVFSHATNTAQESQQPRLEFPRIGS